jgi:hypothetical protein
VTHFDGVAQAEWTHPLGQQPEERAEVVGLERFAGANCQMIGPSFGPSSASPLAMNRSIDSPASARTRRLVA